MGGQADGRTDGRTDGRVGEQILHLFLFQLIYVIILSQFSYHFLLTTVVKFKFGKAHVTVIRDKDEGTIMSVKSDR
jgi:hypothetical protein